MSLSLNQFGHGLRIIFDEELRPAVDISQSNFVRIDAQVVVKGGIKFAKLDRAL